MDGVYTTQHKMQRIHNVYTADIKRCTTPNAQSAAYSSQSTKRCAQITVHSAQSAAHNARVQLLMHGDGVQRRMHRSAVHNAQSTEHHAQSA